MFFNLLSAKQENHLYDHKILQTLERKYHRKITDVVVHSIGRIDSPEEMAYFQLSKGSFAAYRSKPLAEALAYFTCSRPYQPGDTVYFKDVLELWSPSANQTTGKIEVSKVKSSPETKSASVLFLKVLFELHQVPFEYVQEGFSKVGFKYPEL